MIEKEKIHFRFADAKDIDTYFAWINEESVRNNSFQSAPVLYENHINWFKNKLNSPDCFLYFFYYDNDIPIGQVRIEWDGKENVIDISIDKDFRGKSLGSHLLKIASTNFLNKNPDSTIYSYIKTENIASYNSFVNAGYQNIGKIILNNIEVYKLFKILK